MSIFVDVLQAGSNNHPTTSETANAWATDFLSDGIVGTVTSTLGIAPSTGGFAVNAQGSPNMTVAVTAGKAYVTATPTGQGSQRLRVRMDANQNVTINANATGSVRYDWIYIKIDPSLANNPDTPATTVGTLVTSRSTSNSTDNGGAAPTYGYLIAVVTVANAASSITNGNITDKRAQMGLTGGADNSINPSVLQDAPERIADHVRSGGVVAISSGLVGTFSDIVYYIAGKRYAATSIANKTYTASQDTYVDIDTTGLVTYTGVANGAAAPALAANSIRVAIVITSGSAITRIVQLSSGITPPASGSLTLYQPFDSLGNAVYPNAPVAGAGLSQHLIGGHFSALRVKLPIIIAGGNNANVAGSGFQSVPNSYIWVDGREYQVPGKTTKARLVVFWLVINNGSDQMQFELFDLTANARLTGSAIIDETAAAGNSGTTVLYNSSGAFIGAMSPAWTLSPSVASICYLRIANQSSVTDAVRPMNAYVEVYWE